VPYAVETIGLTRRFAEPRNYLDLLLRPFSKREITALDDVNLRVGKGEIFGILGPNGAGKTTFIKILCTLILPTTGTALVNGHDVTMAGRKVRRTIGYVVNEERSFYWRLTGRQNLRFFAALNNLSPTQAEARMREAVELTGLGDALDRTFKEYSSGAKQKLAIARGLLSRPEILLLDEPTRNLDPLASRSLRQFIGERIVDGGKRTVILATNNMREAEELCDRIAILHQGRVRMCGTLDKIRKAIHGRRRYVLSLRGPRPEIERRLSQLQPRAGIISLSAQPSTADMVTLQLDVDEKSVSASDIVRKMVGAGIDVESCRLEEPSLDELFAEILG